MPAAGTRTSSSLIVGSGSNRSPRPRLRLLSRPVSRLPGRGHRGRGRGPGGAGDGPRLPRRGRLVLPVAVVAAVVPAAVVALVVPAVVAVLAVAAVAVLAVARSPRWSRPAGCRGLAVAALARRGSGTIAVLGVVAVLAVAAVPVLAPSRLSRFAVAGCRGRGCGRGSARSAPVGAALGTALGARLGGLLGCLLRGPGRSRPERRPVAPRARRSARRGGAVLLGGPVSAAARVRRLPPSRLAGASALAAGASAAPLVQGRLARLARGNRPSSRPPGRP